MRSLPHHAVGLFFWFIASEREKAGNMPSNCEAGRWVTGGYEQKLSISNGLG